MTLENIPFISLFIILSYLIITLSYKAKAKMHFFTKFDWCFNRLQKELKKSLKANNKHDPHSTIEDFFKFAYRKTEDPKFILIIDYWENVYSRFPDEFILELKKSTIPQNPKEPFSPYFSGQKISKHEAYQKYYKSNELFYNRLLQDIQEAKKSPETYNSVLLISKLIEGISVIEHPKHSSVIKFWYKVKKNHLKELIELLEKSTFSEAAISELEQKVYSRKENLLEKIKLPIITDKPLKIITVDFEKQHPFREKYIELCIGMHNDGISQIMLGRMGGIFFKIIEKRNDDDQKTRSIIWSQLLKINDESYFKKTIYFINAFYKNEDNKNCIPTLTKKHFRKIRKIFCENNFQDGIDLIDQEYPDLKNENN